MKAIVTGASSGIGLAITQELPKRGHSVIAGSRSIGKSKIETLLELQSIYGSALTLRQLDITSDQSVESFVKGVAEIDVLVNNAGFGFLGPVEEFEISEVVEQFETNYFGALRMIKKVVPIMRKQNRGHIINVSSINGRVSFPLYGIYSASKFALETTSEVLQFELHPFNILVTVIEPGVFLTNFGTNRKQPQIALKQRSQYQRLTEAFMKRLDHTKSHIPKLLWPLFDPRRVAVKTVNIIENRSNRLRYLIGIDAHIFYWLDRILPRSLKQSLLSNPYNWK